MAFASPRIGHGLAAQSDEAAIFRQRDRGRRNRIIVGLVPRLGVGDLDVIQGHDGASSKGLAEHHQKHHHFNGAANGFGWMIPDSDQQFSLRKCLKPVA